MFQDRFCDIPLRLCCIVSRLHTSCWSLRIWDNSTPPSLFSLNSLIKPFNGRVHVAKLLLPPFSCFQRVFTLLIMPQEVSSAFLVVCFALILHCYYCSFVQILFLNQIFTSRRSVRFAPAIISTIFPHALQPGGDVRIPVKQSVDLKTKHPVDFYDIVGGGWRLGKSIARIWRGSRTGYSQHCGFWWWSCRVSRRLRAKRLTLLLPRMHLRLLGWWVQVLNKGYELWVEEDESRMGKQGCKYRITEGGMREWDVILFLIRRSWSLDNVDKEKCVTGSQKNFTFQAPLFFHLAPPRRCFKQGHTTSIKSCHLSFLLPAFQPLI